MSTAAQQVSIIRRRLASGLAALLVLALTAASAHARAGAAVHQGSTYQENQLARAHGASTGARRAATGATNVLAPTPYMGWDTYFTFGAHYDEATVLAQASQLLTRGLARKGYRYVWLDVGWWQGTRNAAGEITVSPTQWPHGM
ncbi:MAG TPA: hypothetical protein VGH21_08455, partial [Solirubrobacteraceae bacterium]